MALSRRMTNAVASIRIRHILDDTDGDEITASTRVTEDGEARVTEEGETRLIEE